MRSVQVSDDRDWPFLNGLASGSGADLQYRYKKALNTMADGLPR